jgi:hypothetical protein
MTNTNRQDIIARVAKTAGLPRLQPGEFTVAHYASARHCHYQMASRDLRRAFFAGHLTRRKIVHKGTWKWAYKPKKPAESDT